ncbi:MAG: rhamnulokinase [Lachnospiraceae bacterium]|nr:rhamnulokinase [Lachnospiraceae bacterium]
MDYYLAIDIGASSGRHVLGYIENGIFKTEEIYRFKNGIVAKHGKLVWDTKRLFKEILTGMKMCKSLNKVPKSVAIDTWAVDYVLLDKNDDPIGDTYAYRDNRTKGMDERVYKIISEEELYSRTGIQKQPFNTIYQLMAEEESDEKRLKEAKTMLLLPDYFNFMLTGEKASEYTNASTTQLLSPASKDWDKELIRMLGIPEDIFMPVRKPSEKLGMLREEIKKEVGYDCEVTITASHDTASAVIAVPSLDDSLYISSGTWSLMGTEIVKADLSEESRLLNLTNEGGMDYRFRFLKNIMGMWMVNSVKEEMCGAASFTVISDLAEKADIDSTVDVTDPRFLAPVSMAEEIRKACMEKGMKIPKSIGGFVRVIYQSLAKGYLKTAMEIEGRTQKKYDTLHIVGGGSKAELLNQMVADTLNMTVTAGPAEATAVGNIAVQMIGDGVFEDLLNARKCIKESFGVKTYIPKKKEDQK